MKGRGYTNIAIIYFVGGILWILETMLAMFSLRTTYRCGELLFRLRSSLFVAHARKQALPVARAHQRRAGGCSCRHGRRNVRCGARCRRRLASLFGGCLGEPLIV